MSKDDKKAQVVPISITKDQLDWLNLMAAHAKRKDPSGSRSSVVRKMIQVIRSNGLEETVL